MRLESCSPPPKKKDTTQSWNHMSDMSDMDGTGIGKECLHSKYLDSLLRVLLRPHNRHGHRVVHGVQCREAMAEKPTTARSSSNHHQQQQKWARKAKGWLFVFVFLFVLVPPLRVSTFLLGRWLRNVDDLQCCQQLFDWHKSLAPFF